jgi:hypothetical protein
MAPRLYCLSVLSRRVVTIRVPIEKALPTASITDMETNTRGDAVAPVETVRVTKMVTVLACPAEYDTQEQ